MVALLVRACFMKSMERRTFLVLGLSLAAVLPARAADLAPPAGDVVLRVTGNLGVTNAEGAAQFDLPMLRALDRRTIRTSTIWTQGVQEFAGVSLTRLVTELGLTGSTLRATAINDYTVDIPMSDAVENGPIIAYELNGAPMSVRDKGPLWIIYPYDLDADYRTEVIYTRSIWQLDRLEALD